MHPVHEHRIASSRRAILIAVTASLLVLAPIASASPAPQSEAELRVQNEQLQGRVRQLESELAAALARVQQLEAALGLPSTVTPGSAPSAPDSAPPMSPPPVLAPGGAAPAVAPTNPFENATTVLAAIRARFAADFAGKPAPREGTNDEQLARLWTVEAERWSNLVNREFRKPIVWTVRIVSAQASGRSWRMEVICVDPASRTDVGRPFPIQIQQPQSSSFESRLKLGSENDDFTLRGVLIPQVVLNPTRFEEGPFDTPPFIGTFLEFGFRISVTSLTYMEPRKGQKPGTPPSRTAPSTPSAPTPPAGPPPAPPTMPSPGAFVPAGTGL